MTEDVESRAEKKLQALGDMSDRLGDFVGKAIKDKNQFRRYIVSEKGKDESGENVTNSVEKVFSKVEFKSVKDAACAIKAIADTVKTVYSIQDAPQPGEDGGAGRITVSFENGEEYSL